jgi:cobalt-zinc-cadmium efflux system protein
MMLAGDRDKSRRLMLAATITAVVCVAELVGGLLSGSLALLSDAAHVFADVFSLLLSFFALRLACRVPTVNHNYGFHRAEIFAALINGLALFAIAAFIGHEAWQRVLSPPEIHTGPMLTIAIIGLLANAYVLLGLRGHAHDLNLHSAYLHVLGDLLASVGVVAAAAVMAATGWYLADPIISAVIGLLIVVSAARVVREATHILMQGVPPSLDLGRIIAAVQENPEICAVHNLRVWAVCSNAYILTAHIVTCPETESERRELRDRLRDMLHARFGVVEATLELECEPCAGGQMIHPLSHAELAAEHHHHHHHHDHDHDHDHET